MGYSSSVSAALISKKERGWVGERNHLIMLTKPKKKPGWMSQEEYDQTLDTLKVREMKAGGKIMVTTILCTKEASKGVLKSLFRDRWNVGLDLRSIKTTVWYGASAL